MEAVTEPSARALALAPLTPAPADQRERARPEPGLSAAQLVDPRRGPTKRSASTPGRPGVVVAAVLLALTAGPAGAQVGKDPVLAKIGGELAALHQEYLAFAATAGAGVPFRSANPRARVAGGRVVIDAVAATDPAVLLADLVARGLQQPAVAGRVVSGRFPVDAIPLLVALPSLQFVRQATAVTRVGQVTGQGDRAMRAAAARAAFGVTGEGVPVGVLSDSFDCLGGSAGDVGSGDLSPVQVLQDEPGCASGTDEGRAMLQIVHDVAPGAPLLFATAFSGQAGFAANITALATAGAKVIVDDVLYFAEPMFQDGVIAQAVDAAVASGVTYFSAAGNEGRVAYASAFRDGPVLANGAIPSAPGAAPFFGGVAHDFDPGPGVQIFQDVTLAAGRSVDIVFQWADPFFSVSGAPGAGTDLDLYVLDRTGSVILVALALANGGADPVEVLNLQAGNADLHLKLLIVRYSGPAPAQLKYVVQGGLGRQSTRFSIDSFDTRSGTVYGHANAAGAEAVGAASYVNTPEFGACPPVLELFSSAGTTPILFTPAGAPASDLRTTKPGLVAPDGVNTTFFGADVEPDGVPNFFGTSAAAPHAGAAAALLRQAEPGLTPVQVYARLRGTALDLGPAGFDSDAGFGLVQADAALAAPAGGPPLTHTVLWPPPNPNGWHRTDAAVTLAASHPEAPGVRAIHFTLSGAQTGTGVVPGACATVPVTAEGETEITYFAVDTLDAAGAPGELTVRIDRTPPVLACQVGQGVLGTGRHALRTISTSVAVADGLSGPEGFRLVSVISSEPDEGTDPADRPGDVQGWAVGTADVSGQLRAESSGGTREYRLTYEGQDLAGNITRCELVVSAGAVGSGRPEGQPGGGPGRRGAVKRPPGPGEGRAASGH